MVISGIFFLSVVLFIKHLALKKQIRNLNKQIEDLSNGACEKMLDISLIDKDLEKLAGRLNQYYAKQRYSVACALQHEELLKESIANISHDLRTPLTVIIGHLQLLQNSSLAEEQSRRVETALHKAKRMKELIGAFYDLIILETDQKEPQKENLNISNLLIDFLAENAPLFESRSIEPKIALPEYSIFVQTDRNMIERILQNLLSNAVCYSDGEIGICLSTSTEGDMVLCINNTVKKGADFDIRRLFERFYTGDEARHGESTGLGLAVVKLLVEKLGGSITAEIQSNVLSIELKLQ